MSRSVKRLTVRPLTPDLWPALVDLFGKHGGCGGCWCMYWRIGAGYRRRPAEENKAAFEAVVRRGPAPGVVAMIGELAVGWCQVTPREQLPWMEKNWRVRRVDEAAVWAISCLYVRIGYRRRGVTAALIDGALRLAKAGGAPAVEAYPLDATRSPSATGTGYASTFARLGFKTVARHTPERPIMRHDLKGVRAMRKSAGG